MRTYNLLNLIGPYLNRSQEGEWGSKYKKKTGIKKEQLLGQLIKAHAVGAGHLALHRLLSPLLISLV